MKRRRAALGLLAALLGAPAAAPATTELEMAAEARAALARAEARAATDGAVAEATRAVEAGLAAMREGMRRAADRQAALAAAEARAEEAAAARLGALEVASRAPLAAWTHRPEGPLRLARGALLAASLTRGGDAAAARVARSRADAADRADAQRAAHDRMREALAALQAGRSPSESDLRASLRRAASALGAFVDAVGGPPPARMPPPRPPAPGSLPLPVAGEVLSAFGAPDAIGQPRAGILVSARPWAVVRAPATAFVRYAGALGGQGGVVILEPAPGRLLILAGLHGLAVSAGEVALGGAALGHAGVIPPSAPEFVVESPLAEGALSDAMLYVEAREDGAPVDPVSWFAYE